MRLKNPGISGKSQKIPKDEKMSKNEKKIKKQKKFKNEKSKKKSLQSMSTCVAFSEGFFET